MIEMKLCFWDIFWKCKVRWSVLKFHYIQAELLCLLFLVCSSGRFMTNHWWNERKDLVAKCKYYQSKTISCGRIFRIFTTFFFIFSTTWMFCVSLPIRLIVSFVFPISVIIYYSYQAYINWENQNLDWVGVHS